MHLASMLALGAQFGYMEQANSCMELVIIRLIKHEQVAERTRIAEEYC